MVSRMSPVSPVAPGDNSKYIHSSQISRLRQSMLAFVSFFD
jgi:hypothetical protein